MNIGESPILEFKEILKETKNAYQIKFSESEICWLPKSQIRIIGKNLYIPEWLIKDKNLIGYKII